MFYLQEAYLNYSSIEIDVRGSPLTLERSKDVSYFCHSVLSLDRSIVFVGAINKNGRIFESSLRDDGLKTKLDAKDFEMQFMQHSLHASMMRDFDTKLGVTKFTVVEREKVSEFVFPFSLGIVLVLADPQTNPKKLAKKISKMVYELNLWLEAKQLR